MDDGATVTQALDVVQVSAETKEPISLEVAFPADFRGPYMYFLWKSFVANPEFFKPLHQTWLVTYGYGVHWLKAPWKEEGTDLKIVNNSVRSLIHVLRRWAPTAKPLGVASAYKTSLGDYEVSLPADEGKVYVGGPFPETPNVPHPYHPGSEHLAKLALRLL